MSIQGSVPAHSYYGKPVSGNRPAGEQAGSRIAAGSGPYLGGRGNKCMAKEDTCQGNRVKNQDFCAGHMRSLAKTKRESAVDVSSEVEEVDDGV